MIDDDTDPDSTIERFVGLWLGRYYQTELAALLSERSSTPVVDRLRQLFCGQVCQLFNAVHHRECADKPEQWFDVVAGNLIMAIPETQVGPAEMLLALFADRLEDCDWSAVVRELQHSAPSEPSEQYKPTRRRFQAVCGHDPESGASVKYANVREACEALGIRPPTLYKAIANDSKLAGFIWSYTEPTFSNSEEIESNV